MKMNQQLRYDPEKLKKRQVRNSSILTHQDRLRTFLKAIV